MFQKLQFLTLSLTAVVLIFLTVAKNGVGGWRGCRVDSTVSNCVSRTKPVFVRSCMWTESQRGQWAESLMVHNPDFTL